MSNHYYVVGDMAKIPLDHVVGALRKWSRQVRVFLVPEPEQATHLLVIARNLGDVQHVVCRHSQNAPLPYLPVVVVFSDLIDVREISLDRAIGSHLLASQEVDHAF